MNTTVRHPALLHSSTSHKLWSLFDLQKTLLMMGGLALVFQVIKAITTGFWMDEAWILRPIRSYLEGYGWQRSVSLPGEPFLGIYFDSEVISNGPTVLFPALGISLLLGKISPPALHLFILSHLVLVYLSLKLLNFLNRLEIMSCLLIALTMTPQIYLTQFLGECPGAFWLVFALAIIALAVTDRKKENLVLVGGAALGLSFLAKLIFAVSIIPILTLVFFLNLRKPFFFLKLIVAFFIPILIWHLYELIHVGSWRAYFEVQSRHLAYFNDPLMGSGLRSVKTIKQIGRDVLKFVSAGPGFLGSLFFLTYSIKNFKLPLSGKEAWFWLCWIALAAGLAWWFLVADFKFHADGALIRHSTGFVCFGLVPSSVYFFGRVKSTIERWKLTKIAFFLRSLFMITCLLSFSSVIIKKCWLYLFQKKGYGVYSSWADQKQLAKWINVYGTSNQLLHLMDCDPGLLNDVFASHIAFPQEVLSTGLFKTSSCDLNVLANTKIVVVFNAEAVNLKQNLSWVLLEGTSFGQGLWSHAKPS